MKLLFSLYLSFDLEETLYHLPLVGLLRTELYLHAILVIHKRLGLSYW